MAHVVSSEPATCVSEDAIESIAVPYNTVSAQNIYLGARSFNAVPHELQPWYGTLTVEGVCPKTGRGFRGVLRV